MQLLPSCLSPGARPPFHQFSAALETEGIPGSCLRNRFADVTVEGRIEWTVPNKQG
jgi:hypothetical protein